MVSCELNMVRIIPPQVKELLDLIEGCTHPDPIDDCDYCPYLEECSKMWDKLIWCHQLSEEQYEQYKTQIEVMVNGK